MELKGGRRGSHLLIHSSAFANGLIAIEQLLLFVNKARGQCVAYLKGAGRPICLTANLTDVLISIRRRRGGAE